MGPLAPGTTVIYDEESEGQYHSVITHLATLLSDHLQCPALAFLNHDDDILQYWLFERGELIDTYNSWPGCFEDTGSATPMGGNSEIVCKSFGLPGLSSDIQQILHHGDFVFEFQRHLALAKSLNMNEDLAILGFVDFQTERLPEETEEIKHKFIRI